MSTATLHELPADYTVVTTRGGYGTYLCQLTTPFGVFEGWGYSESEAQLCALRKARREDGS